MNKFYDEIDKALKSYEEFKPYHTKSLAWITDRIYWCYKWKKNYSRANGRTLRQSY